jgi:hypothetical protein
MIDADSMPLNRRIRAKEVGDSYQEKMAKIYSKEDKLEQEIDKYPPEIRRTEAEAVEIQNIRSKLSLLRKQARDLLAERDRKLDELSPLREQTLDEVLTDKAKDLLTAYPELKDVKVSFSVMGGSTRGLCEIDEDGDLNGIKIREGMSDAQTRSTLMHEIQHAVQLLEGFARGGSAEIFVRAKEYHPHITFAHQRPVLKRMEPSGACNRGG